MRAVLGLLGLLIVLSVTGFLVRQQMKASHLVLPDVPAIGQADSTGEIGTAAAVLPPSATPVQQSQQVQQQFKQALDKALQARPMPDDKQ